MAKEQTKEIKFRVPLSEYEELKQQADAVGLSVNKFCRENNRKKKRNRKTHKDATEHDAVLQCADDICSMRELFNRLVLDAIEDKIIYADEVRCMEQQLYKIEQRQADMLQYLRRGRHG